MKIMKEKNIIGKGKYIVKVVNQPHIKVVWKLRNKNSKITSLPNK